MQESYNLAWRQGILPHALPPSKATTTDWKVPPLPDELKQPGIEVSGPVSVTHMFINALNPQPDGSQVHFLQAVSGALHKCARA